MAGRREPLRPCLRLSTALVSGIALLPGVDALAQSAPAQWTGNAGTTFSDGGNWSTAPLAPGPGDAAEIASGVAIVSPDAAVATLAVSGGTLRVQDQLTVGNGTLLSAGQIEVLVGGTLSSGLTVTGGVLSVSGLLGGDLVLMGGSAVNDGTISGDTTVSNAPLTNNGTLAGLTVETGGIVINNATGTITGDTVVSAGSLTNNGTAADVSVSSGAIFVNNSGAVAGDLANAGTASNAGTLAKLANTGGSFTNNSGGVVTGATQVSGGTVTNNATLGAVSVYAAGIFTNNTGATAGAVSNAGTASNAGTIASLSNTGGVFTNNGGGTVTGTTTVLGGTLTNNAGLANVAVVGDGRVVNNTGATAGAVSNAGNFSNGGTVASLTNTDGLFENSGTITGSASVSGGTLVNDGTVAGTLFVSGTGMLSGTGSVGLLSVGAGGILSPGPGLATLSVTGDLTLGAGSTYAADIASTGASDLVTVGGTAQLSGATLQLVAASQVYQPGTGYTVLTANAISGQFSSVISDFAFLSPLLTYGATQVSVDLDRNAVSFASLAQTANGRAAASAADALSATDPLYLAAVSLSRSEAPGAFEQLDGDLHASLKSTLLEDSQFLRDQLLERMRTDEAGKDTFWAAVFGASTHMGSDGNAEEVKSRLTGALIGADGILFDNDRFDGARVGVVVGASRKTVTEPESGDSADVDSYHAGLYASTWLGPITVSAGAAWSGNRASVDRQVNFGSVSNHLTSDDDSDTAQVFAEVSTDLRAGDMTTLQPFANLAHVRLYSDGFAEEGGIAALTGRRSEDEATLTTLGIRTATTFAMGSVPVTLTGELGWRHSIGDVSPATEVGYAGGSSFSIEGVPLARDAVILKAGIEAQLAPAIRLTLNWNGLFSDHMVSNRATILLAGSF
ncbi:autotransporter domain-containing protein [Rhizobium sp. SGZ-381]|uniref:autotransporter outer membrane beta-barrel domain-containing protein n=1 Tax=Rhizobium sp. SGZ-381 TaxID=3342800 RepID=UPI00366E903A